MKLISMREYVLEQMTIKQSTSEFKETVVNYAKFLSQPLTLGMFVPCDEEGNVLEEPELKDFRVGFDEVDSDYDPKEVEKYKQAKERVLFEGFEWGGNFAHKTDYEIGIDEDTCSSNIVEVFVRSGLTLTQQAIKQIGG